MKITIYELLGLVKDGKAPKKIEYNGKIYNYEDSDYFAIDYGYFFDRYNVSGILNNKVEIIEPQEHKIPEKIIIGKKQPVHRIKKIEKKINEILDYLEDLK